MFYITNTFIIRNITMRKDKNKASYWSSILSTIKTRKYKTKASYYPGSWRRRTRPSPSTSWSTASGRRSTSCRCPTRWWARTAPGSSDSTPWPAEYQVSTSTTPLKLWDTTTSPWSDLTCLSRYINFYHFLPKIYCSLNFQRKQVVCEY